MPDATGATSNFDEATIFDEIAHAFDLDGPGLTHGTLANDIAYINGNHIQERTLNRQITDSGSELEANRGRYGERKREAGIAVGVGFHDGPDDEGEPRMLDIAQMVGRIEPAPTATEMTQVFGTTEHVRDKVGWFDRGNAARNQPPRPAFGVDDDLADRIVDHLLDKFDQTFGR